jgi:hypothetical protein
MNKIIFPISLILFYYLWVFKKYILYFFNLGNKTIEIVTYNQLKLLIFKEKRRSFYSGASTTENEFLKLIDFLSKKYKKNNKNSSCTTYLIFGFNALCFLYLKSFVNSNIRVLYYPHDLYYKNLRLKFIKEIHKYIHNRVIDNLCDVILHCNKNELNELAKIFPDKKFLYITPKFFNATSYDKVIHKRVFSKTPTLIFIGSAIHSPNLLFMRIFIKHIFPDVRKAYPKLILNIIGLSLIDFNFKKYEKVNFNNIRFHGIVSNKVMNKLLLNSDIGISPIRINSGVNMKILDYLFYGFPVLADISAIDTLPQSKNLRKFIYTPITSEEWIESIRQGLALHQKPGNQLFIKSYLEKNFDFSKYSNLLTKVLMEANLKP